MNRVLLIEDSPTQAEHLKLVLESTGYEVQVARDGLQGLSLFKSSAFDLVLSDIVMPGLTGYEVCRKIKADPLKKSTPVILLTTLKDPMDIIQGLECGADNFITKPYQPEYLLGRIQGVLKSKALRADGKLKVGAEISFLGRTFTVTSEKEQILDLLLATFEEIVRSNETLQATQAELTIAKARVEDYARQLEGRARSSEEKYKNLMASANDGIFLLGSDGRIQEINRKWEELVARPRGQVIGNEIKEFIVPTQRPSFERSFQDLFGHRSARVEQIRIDRPDGRVVYVDLSMSLLDLNREQIILSIAHDITAQRNLQDQLRQAQKMEAIGRLAGGIAHDFNNLLTVISGYSEFLMNRLSPDDSNRVMVQEIFGSGKRAASLTSQLLAFSRQQVVAPRILDLNAIIRDAERMLKRVIGEDIQLRCVLDDNIGKVEADPGQMEQIVLNLVVNARDAMPNGGHVTIETGNVELDDACAGMRPGVRPGPYVMMAVTDTGCGMDEETKARIFEPFFTTKEVGKGTGLGLATVYGIVNQAGGHIFVYSEVGLGTTFKIFFPRVESEAPAEKPASVYLPAPRGTETLLIVEDESAVRLLTRQALEASGYTVLEAGGAQEAMRLCSVHNGPIHLLVTDVVMPQMSGRELASRVTASRPDTRVLFVSGYTNDTVVRHGVLVGEADFLQKPFTPGILCRKVREVLDKKKPPVAAQQPGSGEAAQPTIP